MVSGTSPLAALPVTLTVFLATLAFPGVAGNGDEPPAVIVAEMFSDPGDRPEFVELLNAGPRDVDLAGWSIHDRAGTTYTFDSGWVLGPRARVVLWSGPGAEDTPHGPAWRRGTVWNNDGDAATLVDPAGRIIDWLGYGSGRADPPPGFEGRGYPAAPGRGLSTAWHSDHWEEGDPTPAAAENSNGEARLSILNAAPVVRFLDAPDGYEPGEPVAVTIAVTDPNGPADAVTWRIADARSTQFEGHQQGPHELALVAPAADRWTLDLLAEDAAGASSTARLDLFAWGGLVIHVPESGAVPLPALEPGAVNVTSLAPVAIENRAREALVPLIDVAEFRNGPHRIETADRLLLGIDRGTGPTTASTLWYSYIGPLTPLPAIPPGETLQLWLRLPEVPSQLPAGDYVTSFAVVT